MIGKHQSTPSDYRISSLAKYTVLMTALMWLVGLLGFVTNLPPPTPVIEAPTNGVVVLTGGVERIDGGLRLLNEYPNGRLLISGVDPRIDRETLRATLSHGQDAFDCCVDLGRTAADTWGNAQEIALWAEERGYYSLTVVTANYHMPRSLLEIQRAAPHLSLVAYPVISSNVPVEGWWWHPRTAVLIATGYTKFLLSFVTSSTPRSG